MNMIEILDRVVTPANVRLGHTWLKRCLRQELLKEERVDDSDGPNLKNAVLFATDARGIYIPQYWADNIDKNIVTGVSKTDYLILKAGPEHRLYWEAWADVLDNAKINHPELGECYLHQDGDLWVVPVEKEEAVSVDKVVLGYVFKPMTSHDWDCFAGADMGSLICHTVDRTLILNPDGTVSEIFLEGDDTNQIDWVPRQVVGSGPARSSDPVVNCDRHLNGKCSCYAEHRLCRKTETGE